MRKGIHFIELPDEPHPLYSAEGIKRLSMGLQAVCASRSTKSWNSAVEDSIFQTLKEVAKPFLLDDKELNRAKQRAKSKAGQRCEITNNKKDSDTNPRFQLEVHHLYDSRTYPFLRYELTNLIAMDGLLHERFHQWMGGTRKSCTGDDLLQWLMENAHEIFGDSKKSLTQQAAAMANLHRRMQILRPAVNARNSG